jgi:hypothetical protein
MASGISQLFDRVLLLPPSIIDMWMIVLDCSVGLLSFLKGALGDFEISFFLNLAILKRGLVVLNRAVCASIIAN